MSPRGSVVTDAFFPSSLLFHLVFGEDELRHHAAHRDVVAGVGHVVDEEVAAERLGHRRGVVGRRFEQARDVLRQAAR